MTESVAIHASQLNLWYGAFQALRDVELEIPRGIVAALIGPSGCGKSTLLRCMNRMNDRAGARVSGALRVLGDDVHAPTVSLESLRRQVGMVFQRPNPLPMSVYDNVIFGARTHASTPLHRDELDRLVEESLRRVELWAQLKERLGDDARTLQIEAAQKLCIARLLPLKPQVILLDEPCSALDPRGTAAVETLLRQLRGEYTLVIVTHSMAQARRTGDVCSFMLMGELVEHGETQQIFEAPRDSRTADYVAGRFG
jgi:phosphate transport system ATP-binding protein